jgi:tetratricopeptide (TPR) repeat protein
MQPPFYRRSAWLIISIVIVIFLFCYSSKTAAEDLKNCENKGWELYQAGNYKEAQEWLTKAISLNPSDQWAYFTRGKANYDLGNMKAAFEDFNQTLTINPEYPNAHTSRGMTRYNLNDMPGAILDFDQAIRANPNDATAYTNPSIII